MARMMARLMNREAPILIMANVFLRWRVVRKLPKLRQYRLDAKNGTSQTEEDEDLCLMCWDPFDAELDVQETSPNNVAQSPTSDMEILPLQDIVSNDTLDGGVASSAASTLANAPASCPVTKINEILATSEKKPSLVQSIRSLAKGHRSRGSRDTRDTSFSSQSSVYPTLDVVQCTRGHKYHYNCLHQWIKEKGEHAPRLCEMCNNPYMGDKGRELISLSIRQTLEAYDIPLLDDKSQADRVCEAALAMVKKFKETKDQFFRTEYLSARNLTLVDVDKEFLLMFRIPECLYTQKCEENPSLLSRSIHIRLFRRAAEVLEMMHL